MWLGLTALVVLCASPLVRGNNLTLHDAPLTRQLISFVANDDGFSPDYWGAELPYTDQEADRFLYAIHPPDEDTINIAKHANYLVRVSKKLNIHNDKDLYERLQHGDLDEAEVHRLLNKDNTCTKDFVVCDVDSPYRTIDGRCNNLKRPDWGAAHTPYRRLVTPAYADGFSEPREASVTGHPLPSARLVSIKTTQTDKDTDRSASHLLMQFGQLLVHDLELTAEGEDDRPKPRNAKKQSVLDCSDCKSRERISKVCFPIPIPFHDPNMKPGTCLNFKRSAAGNFKLGHLEQTNQVTSACDGSAVYGSTYEMATMLRLGKGGLLKATKNGGMPSAVEHGLTCAAKDPKHCFIAGDMRVNEQNGLVTLHNIWVQYHNKIAKVLAKINPHWEDGRLYQETKKIIGAMFQIVTYNEWLHKLLGTSIMRKFGLDNQPGQKYNEHCELALANEKSTTTLRLGHTLVDDEFKFIDGTHLNLLNHFFTPEKMQKGMHDTMKFMDGLMHQKSLAVDSKVTDALRNHLFEVDGTGALDLVALNIQRGRDHGIPSYTKLVHKILHIRIKNWDDIVQNKLMTPKSVHLFRKVYKSVDDIDAFVAFASEIPRNGAMVGPSWAAILGEGFRRLKYCDRFFWLWKEGKQAFTRAQRSALNDVTFSKIICDNVVKPSFLGLKAFEVPDRHDRRRLKCLPHQKGLVGIDLRAWKEIYAYDAPINSTVTDQTRVKRSSHTHAHPGGSAPSRPAEPRETRPTPNNGNNGNNGKSDSNAPHNLGEVLTSGHKVKIPIHPRCLKDPPKSAFHLQWE